MKQWDISEAARRLHAQMRQPDTRVVWFLGAGCSISSGIPGAAELVHIWMKDLERLKGDNLQPWILDGCPDWESDPAQYYGLVIDERFAGNPRARQEEIARLVREKEPGFGYACLAQLMSHKEHGRRNNLAFTTNFDDLIADALYLYTQQKPLTVVHDALAGFVRSSESTPLVVKLHGDSQLAPKNTVEETTHLDDRLIAALRRVLRDAIFVFIGYGGNDASIASFLRGCHRDEIAGAYWVSDKLPGDDDFRRWFTSLEGAVHVDHLHFDAFMAELHAEFDLGAPDFRRFDQLKKRYEESARHLTARHGSGSETSERGAEAVDRALDVVEGTRLAREANTVAVTSPQAAEDLFRRALEIAPDNTFVLRQYSGFLSAEGRLAEAGQQARRAVNIDPSDPFILGDLANILLLEGHHEEAEGTFRRCMAMDPDSGISQAHYADFLLRRDRFDEARTNYQVLRDRGLLPAWARSNLAVLDALTGAPDDDEFLGALDDEPSARAAANWAWRLVTTGRRDEATGVIESCLETLRGQWPGLFIGVMTELRFYQVALRPRDHEALSTLKGRLLQGARSPGWHLDPVIAEVAADWGDASLLEALAAVLTSRSDIGMLDAFPEWRAA